MKLSGPEEKINQLKIILQKSTNTFEFDPIIRRDLLLVELLHHEDYLKSQALTIDLDVSIQTIRNDLRKIEKTLKVHNLKLVAKRSEGVIIKGNKLIKNHLLNSLMVRNIDIDVFFDWLNNGKEHANTFIQMLEKYNYRDTLLEISEIVRKLIVEENIKSNDTNFKEFIILLSRIILYGCSEVEYQEFNQAITYKDINNSKILKLEQQLTKQFNKTFNKEELIYVNWLMSVTIGSGPNEGLTKSNKMFERKIKTLISQVEMDMGIKFTGDQTLFDGLSRHVNKTLSRTRKGMVFSNPMIGEIKEKYNEVFNAVKKSAESIFNNDRLPDSEIGYMTLYFIVSMEKNTENIVNVLVICSSGMGSSKMLASRLEKEFPEININKIIPLINLNYNELKLYDLVVSTVPLSLTNDQYLVISPLLNANEVEMVRSHIERIKYKKMDTFTFVSNSRNEIVEKDTKKNLKEINQILSWGINLVQNLKVVSINSEDKESIDVINFIQENFYERKIILSPNEISEFIKIRNEQDYFQIPNTRLAYYESYLEYIKEPIITIYRLANDSVYMYGSREMHNITAIIVVLYPASNNFLLVDFLSDIITMIIENSEVTYAFEIGREVKLKEYIEQRVRKYLLRKL